MFKTLKCFFINFFNSLYIFSSLSLSSFFSTLSQNEVVFSKKTNKPNAFLSNIKNKHLFSTTVYRYSISSSGPFNIFYKGQKKDLLRKVSFRNLSSNSANSASGNSLPSFTLLFWNFDDFSPTAFDWDPDPFKDFYWKKPSQVDFSKQDNFRQEQTPWHIWQPEAFEVKDSYFSNNPIFFSTFLGKEKKSELLGRLESPKEFAFRQDELNFVKKGLLDKHSFVRNLDIIYNNLKDSLKQEKLKSNFEKLKFEKIRLQRILRYRPFNHPNLQKKIKKHDQHWLIPQDFWFDEKKRLSLSFDEVSSVGEPFVQDNSAFMKVPVNLVLKYTALWRDAMNSVYGKDKYVLPFDDYLLQFVFSDEHRLQWSSFLEQNPFANIDSSPFLSDIFNLYADRASVKMEYLKYCDQFVLSKGQKRSIQLQKPFDAKGHWLFLTYPNFPISLGFEEATLKHIFKQLQLKFKGEIALYFSSREKHLTEKEIELLEFQLEEKAFADQANKADGDLSLDDLWKTIRDAKKADGSPSEESIPLMGEDLFSFNIFGKNNGWSQDLKLREAMLNIHKKDHLHILLHTHSKFDIHANDFLDVTDLDGNSHHGDYRTVLKGQELIVDYMRKNWASHRELQFDPKNWWFSHNLYFIPQVTANDSFQWFLKDDKGFPSGIWSNQFDKKKRFLEPIKRFFIDNCDFPSLEAFCTSFDPRDLTNNEDSWAKKIHSNKILKNIISKSDHSSFSLSHFKNIPDFFMDFICFDLHKKNYLPKRGILLAGVPETNKTTFLLAFWKHLSLKFYNMKSPEYLKGLEEKIFNFIQCLNWDDPDLNSYNDEELIAFWDRSDSSSAKRRFYNLFIPEDVHLSATTNWHISEFFQKNDAAIRRVWVVDVGQNNILTGQLSQRASPRKKKNKFSIERPFNNETELVNVSYDDYLKDLNLWKDKQLQIQAFDWELEIFLHIINNPNKDWVQNLKPFYSSFPQLQKITNQDITQRAVNFINKYKNYAMDRYHTEILLQFNKEGLSSPLNTLSDWFKLPFWSLNSDLNWVFNKTALSPKNIERFDSISYYRKLVNPNDSFDTLSLSNVINLKSEEQIVAEASAFNANKNLSDAEIISGANNILSSIANLMTFNIQKSLIDDSIASTTSKTDSAPPSPDPAPDNTFPIHNIYDLNTKLPFIYSKFDLTGLDNFSPKLSSASASSSVSSSSSASSSSSDSSSVSSSSSASSSVSSSVSSSSSASSSVSSSDSALTADLAILANLKPMQFDTECDDDLEENSPWFVNQVTLKPKLAPSPLPDPEPSPLPDPVPSPLPDPEPSPLPDPEPSPLPDPEPSPLIFIATDIITKKFFLFERSSDLENFFNQRPRFSDADPLFLSDYLNSNNFYGDDLVEGPWLFQEITLASIISEMYDHYFTIFVCFFVVSSFFLDSTSNPNGESSNNSPDGNYNFFSEVFNFFSLSPSEDLVL